MPIRSLADFLENIERSEQLRRMEAAVAADQEAAEVTRRCAAHGQPALFFARVVQRRMPLAINLLATERRIALGLNADSLGEVEQRLAGPGAQARAGWLDWLRTGFQSGSAEPWAPRAVRTAACQQVVRLGRDIDLTELPALTCSPHETAPTFYGACVASGGIEADHRTMGLFDAAVIDRNRLAIRWADFEPIARQFEQCRAAGMKLPLAVLLGAPPAVTIAAAAARREPEMDPYALAGLLGAAAIDLTTCRSHALQVPAEADVVIEGHIDPAEPEVSDVSPGCSGGFMHRPSPARTMHVETVTERTSAVATAMVPHQPPDERSTIARVVARLWIPATRRVIPELVDCDLVPTVREGQMAFLSIRKTHAGQARRVAAAWWGQSFAPPTKLLVIVDADVNVHDSAAVWYEAAANADLGRDVIGFDGPAEPRDHAAATPALTRRLAIDATTKLAGESPGTPTARSAASDEIAKGVTARWGEFGFT